MMPKVVKHGRCWPENMERALEALRKGDIGLETASCACSLRKGTDEALRWDKLFYSGKHLSYCRRGISRRLYKIAKSDY
jgi:hypothetical protein